MCYINALDTFSYSMMGPRGNKSSEPTCHSWQMANRSFNFSCISPHQIAFLNSLFPFYQTNATPKTTIIIKKKMFMVSCDAYLLANKSQWIGGIYRNIPRLNYNGHHHHWSILASDHTQSKFQSSMQSHSHIILVNYNNSGLLTYHSIYKGVNSFDRLHTLTRACVLIKMLSKGQLNNYKVLQILIPHHTQKPTKRVAINGPSKGHNNQIYIQKKERIFQGSNLQSSVH